MTTLKQTSSGADLKKEALKDVNLVYVEKDGRYILHRDVELTNGNHVLVDAMSNSII